MERSYREQFTSPEAARRYEKFYSQKTLDSILWEIEKNYLLETVTELRNTVQKIDYLDFACGTGRVVCYLEPFVNTATGIDVSSEMLKIAQQKVKHASLYCKDITDTSIEEEGKYDLITTFRFILNAEPNMRISALRELAKRLKDKSSLLILNNHSNPISYKALLWPYHYTRIFILGRRTSGNYLTIQQLRAVIDAAGLEILSIVGMGFMSAKFLSLLPYHYFKKIETALAGENFISKRFGANQIIICRLK